MDSNIPSSAHLPLALSPSIKLWLRGGFPKSFLANSDEESAEWRRDFIWTYLERDLPALGIRTPSVTLQRFWTRLAHYHT